MLLDHRITFLEGNLKEEFLQNIKLRLQDFLQLNLQHGGAQLKGSGECSS